MRNDLQRPATDYAGDLFGEMILAQDARDSEPKRGARLAALWPGIAACAAVSAAAAWLSDHYGLPIILAGLLLGLALNFLSGEERTHAGLDFASRHFLRLGIVALGLQVTVGQILALGPLPFIGVLLVMAAAFGAAMLAARLLKQNHYSGLLAGGATAICGASAALALYSVIGRQRLPQAQFALTLVGVSMASALAMTIYPLLAEMLQLTDRQAGFLIGASVHDAAQAIGGGFAYSDAAGAEATIVKLARVALLAPLVTLTGLFIQPEGGASGPSWQRLALPWFIVGFLAVLTLNSLVPVPEWFRDQALTASKALLLLAVTATALRTRLDTLLEIGWRALMPTVAASLASFGVALVVAKWTL